MSADYYRIETIDARTFAIHEPHYWQKNVSYLIIGNERALLFDTGPGVRDITPLVRSLTTLAVTALPSHLHFDHVGNLGRLDAVALPDLPAHRARLDRIGRFVPAFGQHLGFLEWKPRPHVHVTAWIPLGGTIDLGGRTLTLLPAPGHSPDSVALLDKEQSQLFAGDFLYMGRLYACLPGANLDAYRDTALRFLQETDVRITILPGHGAKRPRRDDLAALADAIDRVRSGTATKSGFPRRIVVNPGIELLLPLVSRSLKS